MSQPPTPYTRSYSFTGWQVSNPNDPLRGNYVDQQLDNIATSLSATISRLNEIQRDDGAIRDTALPSTLSNVPTLAASAQASANSAATSASNAAGSATAASNSAGQAATSATQAASTVTDFNNNNLASLTSKSDARANLQLNQYYAQLTGANLTIFNDSNLHPTFASTSTCQTSQNQAVQTGSWPDVLGTSTYASRQFRASVLFGTLKDYPTDFVDISGSPVPDATIRVDNVSMALLGAGMLPITGYGNEQYNVSTTGLLSQNYKLMNNLPNIGNPLVSLFQLKDAVDTHNAAFNHSNIPSANQKAALDAATTASGTNRFATLNDITASGSLTANQTAAIVGSDTPSATNVMITTSALNTGLATKANTSHTHTISQITGLQAALDLEAPLASPAFTGTPTAPTAAVNTNTTQLATTAFVLGQANSTAGTIAMSGTQSAGTSNLYARADHVHPTDTTRAPLASPNFTGTPTAPTATTGTNTTQIATTAFVLANAGGVNNVKAWVNFNPVDTLAIRASLNVSSVTDFGLGDYRVNFTTAISDANYAAHVTADTIVAATGASYLPLVILSQLTTSVRFYQVDIFSEPTIVNVTIIR